MGTLTQTTEELQIILDDASEENYAFAYLNASADTTITTGMAWYPILGTFTNSFSNFELDTDKIKYIGNHDHIFEIDWSAKAASDTVSATFNVTVSINGTPVESSKMGGFAKTAGEPISFSGTDVVELSPNDTVQLVIQSDKAGSVITVYQFVTTITKFVLPRQ